MRNFRFDLPTGRRLGYKTTKSRAGLDERPLIPNLGEILRARKGNKATLFLMHFFENPKFKKFLGSNLAALVFASSLLSQNTAASVIQDDNLIFEAPLVLTTEAGVQFPIQKVKITQGYRFYHPGIDLDGITGDEIHPIMAGKVEKIEYSKFGFGTSIIINHGESITSLYAHLSKVSVKVGEEVTKETRLGEMGATGWAKGDHLHLEVREAGESINPLGLLPKLK